MRCSKKVKRGLVSLLTTSLILSSCSKNTPTEIEIPPEQPQIEILTTNQNGNITLSNGKKLHLKDENTPIPNQELIYFPNENYQAILTKKGNFFPVLFTTTNTNPDTLELKSIQENFDIRIIRENYNEYFRFSKDVLENNLERNFCSNYLETVSGEETLTAYSISEGILMYFGVDWIATLVGDIYELAGATDDLEFKEFLLENNWDSYYQETIISEDPFISTKTYFRYPSNKPEITTLEELTIENDSINITLEGADETTYENPLHDQIEDKTITCRGPTENSDFYFSWALQNLQETIHSGTEQSQTLNLQIDNLDPDSYILRITLNDDTFWKDNYNDTGTNQTEIEIPFTIQSSLETLILQPGPDGKDTFIRREETTYGESHIHDNYGQEEFVKSYFKIYNLNHTNETITLIQFDLSQIPQNSNIINSTLELYGKVVKTDYSTDCGDAIMRGYKMESSWNENTATFSNSFQSIDTSHDIAETMIYYDPNDQSHWNPLDITHQTQRWVDNIDQNYGIAISTSGISCSTSGLDEICSSEYSQNSELRPKLTIQYIEE